MRSLLEIRTVAILILAATTFLGCQKETEYESTATRQVSSDVVVPDLPDTTGAAVWSYLQEVKYQENWVLWPEKGQLYTGQEPHGMLLTSYLNEAALKALTTHAGTMPNGAILIKENYRPDSTLAAVTVMYKVAGYNPDHNDWFFSKHLPNGTLDKAPNGMALEGRVPGCQQCHGAQKANDYVYTASLSE